MNELIGAVVLTLTSFVTFSALLTTLAFLIPERAEAVRLTLAARPGRSFIIGLVNLLFFGVLAALFSQGGEVGGLLGLIILLALLGLAVIGLTGLLLLLRQRFYPPHEESDHSLLGVTIRASAILVAALLSPILGWFILAPILLIAGLGAGIITLARRNQSLSATPLSENFD